MLHLLDFILHPLLKPVVRPVGILYKLARPLQQHAVGRRAVLQDTERIKLPVLVPVRTLHDHHALGFSGAVMGIEPVPP